MSEATMPGPGGAAAPEAALNRGWWRAFASRGAIWIVLLGLSVVSSIVSPVFLTSRFISTLLKQAASLGIVAVGQTLAILTGGIDLSVASVMALVSVLASHWMNGQESLVLPVSLAALAVASAIGLANGLMVAKLKIPAFIATLGMILIVQGARFMYTGGTPKGSIPPGIKFIGGGMVGPIPAAVIVWAIVVVVFVILTRWTVFGRRLYATGGNPRTAHLSGVNVNGVIIAAYTLCGLLAGVAGLVLTGYSGFADNWLGRGKDLDSIAAVVVGGTLFSGGRGGVLGTVAGVLIITILYNLVLLLGLDEEVQRIVKGTAIILAVALYAGLRARR
ncbi:MAG TPA: ABC transporter permease [Anaerolineales bacterium]|nr:ABC transporter permease [Anaerolineales bacterium]